MMISMFSQHIATPNSTIALGEGMNWIIKAQRSIEFRTNQFTTKKKPHTRQRIMVMEGGDENMEIDVTAQQDDKSIRMEND